MTGELNDLVTTKKQGIKFGDLAPNWAFKNIGGIKIFGGGPKLYNATAGLNLAIQASIAKTPNLIRLRCFHLYGI